MLAGGLLRPCLPQIRELQRLRTGFLITGLSHNPPRFKLRHHMPPRAKPALEALEAYRPPLEGRNAEDLLLLDFNESTIPPGPEVLEAVLRFVREGRVRTYPAYGDFAEELAAHAGVSKAQVLCTNGADGAIQLLAMGLLSPGDALVMARPGFPIFRSCALAMGVELRSPRYEPPQMHFPIQAIHAAVDAHVRMIVVISPNNPTGTSASIDQVERLLLDFPETFVVVDEVYHEFAAQSFVPLLSRHENLIVLRSFSKALGLAGLRLGYLIAQPQLVESLSRLRIPYDVNALAVVAARAQLRNPQRWQAYVREVMQQAKPLVERFFDTNSVSYVPSKANFILVWSHDPEQVYTSLRRQGILIRPKPDALSNAFRVSIGTANEMRRFIQAYTCCLQEQR